MKIHGNTCILSVQSMCVGDVGWPHNFRGFLRLKLDFLETRYVLKRWSMEWPIALEHITWGSALRTVLGWRLTLPLQAGIGVWHEGKSSSEVFLRPSRKAITSLEDFTVLLWVNQSARSLKHAPLWGCGMFTSWPSAGNTQALLCWGSPLIAP